MEVRFHGLDGLQISLATRRARYELESALAGRHQAWNIATAVVAAEQFEVAGLPAISPAAIAAGVATCRWPGRLEAIRLAGTATTVLLDAAHNPAGCDALVAFLAALDRPFTLAALLPPGTAAALEPEIAAGLERALTGGPELVVACGSIFLIGTVRALLEARRARG